MSLPKDTGKCGVKKLPKFRNGGRWDRTTVPSIDIYIDDLPRDHRSTARSPLYRATTALPRDHRSTARPPLYRATTALPRDHRSTARPPLYRATTALPRDHRSTARPPLYRATTALPRDHSSPCTMSGLHHLKAGICDS